MTLADEHPAAAADHGPPPWILLVVDDDPEVHAVTRLALDGVAFEGRPLEILSAASAAEARQVLHARRDISLILLDVVMETDTAGLDLVHHIREELRNATVRIVLRTGQPGQAPAREVISRYEIDDYCTKTELTFERLYVRVMAALRTYALLHRLERRQQQLVDSNQELERFAYVASHDLQTPLRGMVGYAQLLRRRLGESVDASARELLDDIIKGGQDLHVLINDLLEYSRLGSEAAPRDTIDLNAVTRRALEKLHGMIKERNAEVRFHDLPTVQGNATQLEQLLRNLIDNGIKYQPGTRPVVEIGAQAVDDHWEIRVHDRGIGIEKQYLEQIFHLFRRLHPSDRYPGTGVGLAICRKVVELHGGRIHAESEPGKGTTVVVTLPVKPAPRD